MPENEIRQLEETVYDKERGLMAIEVVGKPAGYIAGLAGLNAPADVRLLIARQHAVGDDYPLSSEILAPVIALYEADGFDDAVRICIDLNFHGGMGHTVSISSSFLRICARAAAAVQNFSVVKTTPTIKRVFMIAGLAEKMNVP